MELSGHRERCCRVISWFGRMAGKDRLRPWLGNILKCPETGFSKDKIRPGFWPETKAGEMLRAGLCARVST